MIERFILPEGLSGTPDNPVGHAAGSTFQPAHDVRQRDPGILPPNRAGAKTVELLVALTKPRRASVLGGENIQAGWSDGSGQAPGHEDHGLIRNPVRQPRADDKKRSSAPQ
ncbi:MAG: hypothetical protein AAB225_28435 [Acidobacteriota bacterium]